MFKVTWLLCLVLATWVCSAVLLRQGTEKRPPKNSLARAMSKAAEQRQTTDENMRRIGAFGRATPAEDLPPPESQLFQEINILEEKWTQTPPTHYIPSHVPPVRYSTQYQHGNNISPSVAFHILESTVRRTVGNGQHNYDAPPAAFRPGDCLWDRVQAADPPPPSTQNQNSKSNNAPPSNQPNYRAYVMIPTFDSLLARFLPLGFKTVPLLKLFHLPATPFINPFL
ncbi:hypothetical protein Ciccas_007918 [Cichlidogyrus casuarinus]|uniref:Uncharacterized protein n=1 Tax=Cichlidogyrus casuarinus TaxID=1844966 RepID=A0ABD2Q1J6_9PLAT